jgi:hypothetical protein
LELEISYEYQMMHSEFLEYSADDRDKAIWFYLRKRQTCQSCGTRPDEWDPEKGGHRAAYLPQIRTCQGCVVIERTREAPQLQSPGARGMSVGLTRNPEAIEG